MFYIADLHLHSHYSRATSRDLNLESLYQWAKVKGIHVVGTGDFTHPAWFKELKEKLEPDGTGFFRLRNPPKEEAFAGMKCSDIDVRFCLTTEISSIYKYGDRVRKNHNLVYAPDFETVAKLNAKLSTIGNLEADGRPILGLSARDLLEITLQTSDRCCFIPAHIWTPWFSMLGSKSGYDSVKECFRDLADYIFALETGLSSDPEMNWHLSMLDKYALVSNSDAHSPQKLGREVNLFETERSYDGMFNAIRTRKGFLGTYEFFPEEGKYHMDGHRKCNVSLEPEETLKYKGLCPVCGEPLTVGVLHRVTALSDRKQAERPQGGTDFHYIIPLPEIIGEIKNAAPNSKGVLHAFRQTISVFGNEFTLLKAAPVEYIQKQCGTVLAEAIKRMREQQVNLDNPGFDGEYGKIQLFKEGELKALRGEMDFFGETRVKKTSKREGKKATLPKTISEQAAKKENITEAALNSEQQQVLQIKAGAILVTAGPGTGKTKTLVHWIANCTKERKAKPQEILAVTFTNKAADEMKERLTALTGDKVRGMTIGTFHSVCYHILQERFPNLATVYDDESREVILRLLMENAEEKKVKERAAALQQYFETGKINYEGIEEIAKKYRVYAQEQGGVDVSDIIGQVVALWKDESEWLERFRTQWNYIAVDELQDINPLQYELLSLLGKEKNILAIGDPDQSIYGFRGADVKLFFHFKNDFNAQEVLLKENYRSAQNILEAACKVIQHNTLRKETNLVANESSKAKIRIFKAENSAEEARYILDGIEELVGGTSNLTGERAASWNKSNYAFSDIAVFFRLRSVGKEILYHLHKAGIPARFGDASSFLSTAPFSMVADIFRLYVNERDVVALHGLLLNGFHWGRKDVQVKLRQMKGEETTGKLSEPAQRAFEEWQDFYKALPQAFQQEGVTGASKAIFEKYLPDEKLDDVQLLKKEAILNMAGECGADMEEFLKRLTLDNYTDVGRMKTDAVHLLTFHAAKGLEFPVVFIAGAEEGISPSLREDSNPEEERRLFYVGMTRARDELQITCSAKRNYFGEEKEMQPSRFIGEIPESLIEIVEKKKEPKEDQLSLF